MSHALGKCTEQFTLGSIRINASYVTSRATLQMGAGKKLKTIANIEDVRYVKMKKVMATIPHLMISMSIPFSHAIRGCRCNYITPGPEEISIRPVSRQTQYCRSNVARTKRRCMDSIYIHFLGPCNMLSQGHRACSDVRSCARKLYIEYRPGQHISSNEMWYFSI